MQGPRLWIGADGAPLGPGDATWFRYAGPGRAAAALPEGPAQPSFGTAVVRLDKAREATHLALAEADARLLPGGHLVLYGGNDEGIRYFDGRDGFTTLDAGGHGRVLARVSVAPAAPPQVGLPRWRRVRTASPAGEARPWVEYPGCFALGGDDEGSVLLVRTLRERPAPVGETLDFGCGPGFLSAAVRALAPRVRIVSQDRDALALEALRENVPEAVPLLSERVDAARAQAPEGFALIVSNPPFHDGRDRTGAVWAGLVESAPKRLAPGGELRLVAQRNVRIESVLRAHFAQVEALVLTPRFAVWSARR